MHLFSKLKMMAAAIIAVVSVGSAFAQFTVPANARVDALAGVPVSDISGVYRYPVMMTGYLDHIQATWGGGFVGVKSVSDAFSIGVLANQGPMDTAFTSAAVGALNNYGFPATLQWTGTLFTDSLVIPHLLLGFDLGSAAIGADIFFEYAGYGATDGTSDYSGSIANPGARLSAKFSAASAEVMAKFGMGFPSVSASGASTSDKLSSDKGMYMEMGAEVGMPIINADWVLGFCYTSSDYRFKTGSVSASNTVTNSLLNLYIGTEFNFVETAIAALGYSLRRNAATAQPTASGSQSQTLPIDYTQSIYAGIENAWDKAWIFDSFQLRGGALYTITSTSGKPSNSVNYAQPANHSTIQPKVGVGVSRAFMTIDVSLNPGAWSGVFTGPEVALVTATVKF
jgi:hypothetical protein